MILRASLFALGLLAATRLAAAPVLMPSQYRDQLVLLERYHC